VKRPSGWLSIVSHLFFGSMLPLFGIVAVGGIMGTRNATGEAARTVWTVSPGRILIGDAIGDASGDASCIGECAGPVNDAPRNTWLESGGSRSGDVVLVAVTSAWLESGRIQLESGRSQLESGRSRSGDTCAVTLPGAPGGGAKAPDTDGAATETKLCIGEPPLITADAPDWDAFTEAPGTDNARLP